MMTQIRTKNYQATEKIKQYVDKRLKKLDKLLDKDADAVVTLIGEKNRHRVEVTIPVNGFILRGEENHEDMMTAIDSVSDKLEKQLVRSKERFSKKGRLSVTKLPSLTDFSPVDSLHEDFVVRTKRFSSEPMSLDDAITQMDMVGHAFFAFSNEETGDINIVYRRNDGHYGLLEPDNVS